VGDGSQTRDFTSVKDVVRANILCISENNALNASTINIGSGTNISVVAIAQKISNNYIFVPERLGEARDTLANISKAEELLGWEPLYNVADYIEQELKNNK
jgi:nucleoside-diphosphate-sugar epimerase